MIKKCFIVLLLGCGLACALKPKALNMADGKYLQAIGKHERAVAFFTEYLENPPQPLYVPEAQYLLGESYERINKPDLAMKAYRQILDIDPKSPYAALSYQRIAKHFAVQEDYEKAIKHYQMAMKVNSYDANKERCTFEIAQIYNHRLEDYEKALKEYRKLTKDLKNPRIMVTAYLNMGRIFKRQGEYDKARAAFETILNQFSWSSQVPEAKKELEKLENQTNDSAG